jgi:hypothetical protein
MHLVGGEERIIEELVLGGLKRDWWDISCPLYLLHNTWGN